jgi:choline dehydrogenase-like flavoprotein
MASYDYIIVGAGTSGCVLAGELSKDPTARVLLLEAGKRDRSPVFHIPKGFAFTIENPEHSFVYDTEPFGPLNQTEKWSRGRVLGGSSAINGMVYNRGGKKDWDSLVAAGNPGWGWEDILPVYQEIEDHQLGASDTRGAGGPLHISVQRNGDSVNEAMLEAAGNVGLKRVDDLNSSDDERVGYVPANIRNGMRQSASKVFLKPAEKRPNLTVRTEAVVTRVIIEGDRAVGVAVASGGTETEIRADKEIILSLGAVETPKLLELSGIGGADVLKAAGVDVVLDRPSVGEKMIEHRYVTLQLRLNDPKLGYNGRLSSGAGQAASALRYLFTRNGPIASPAYDLVGFLKTDPTQPRVDGQILMTPFTQGIKPLDLTLESRPGASIIGNPLRPTTTGSIHVVSGDARVHPRITTNYAFNDEDRRTYVNMFRRMRDIAAQHPFVGMVKAETEPGWAVQDDESVMNHVLLNGGTCFHASGTCGRHRSAAARPGRRRTACDGRVRPARDGRGQPERSADGHVGEGRPDDPRGRLTARADSSAGDRADGRGPAVGELDLRSQVLHGHVQRSRDDDTGRGGVRSRRVLQHVDAAETLGCRVHRLGQGRAVHDVGGEGRRRDTALGETDGHGVQLLRVAGDQGDVETVGAEDLCDGETEAASCPDDGDGGHGNSVPVGTSVRRT